MPKLETMLKNKEMGQILVNDVIHSMVNSRNKKEQNIYLEKLRTSTKHGTKRHSIAATKISSSGGVSRFDTFKRVDNSSQGTSELPTVMEAFLGNL